MLAKVDTHGLVKPIIVSRHNALVDYIYEIRLVPPDTPVVGHITYPEHQIDGRDVFGVLPLHYAARTRSLTVIPLWWDRIRGQREGRENLTLAEIRQVAGVPVTYRVQAFNAPTEVPVDG